MNNSIFTLGASIAIVDTGIIVVVSAFKPSRRGFQVTIYDGSPVSEGGHTCANLKIRFN